MAYTSRLNKYPLINQYEFKKSNDLYLPAYYKKIVPEMEAFATYISHSEIFGIRFSEERLKNILSNLSVYDCLITSSKLATILEADGVFNENLQIELVKELFGDSEVGRYLLSRLGEKGKFVFFEQQILNLAKFALLYAKDIPVNNFNEKKSFVSFLTCLIGVTDLLESDYFEKDKSSAIPEAKNDFIISFIIRNLCFNSHDFFPLMIGRFYNLWMKIPESQSLQKSPNYINLNNLFSTITGFSLKDYFSFGLAISAWYMTRSVLEKSIQAEDYALDEEHYFSKTKIGSNVLPVLMKLFSGTPTEMKASLERDFERTKNLFYYDITTIKRKPMVKVGEKCHVPISLRFLNYKITSGIYWLFREYFSEKSKQQEDRRFTNFFGQIFEMYIFDLLKRIYPTMPTLGSRLFLEIPYKSDYGQVKTIDAFVLYEDELILIQIRSTRLMVDTTIFGDINKFNQDITNMILKNVKTIDRCIKDFKSQKFSLGGANPKHIRKYYPIIITLEAFPVFPPILRRIEEFINKEKYLQQKNIAKLEILDCEEMEMIEAVSNTSKSMLDLIKDKQKSTMTDTSMKNYILKHYNQKQYTSDFLIKETDEITGYAKNLLFGPVGDWPQSYD